MEPILLIHHYSGKLNPVEAQRISEWLQASSKNQAYYNEIIKIWKTAGDSSIFNKINADEDLEKIKVIIKDKSIKTLKSTNRFKLLTGVAAAFLILITSAFIILHVIKTPSINVDEIVINYQEGNGPKLIKLPDGTSVHMKVPSKLVYPKHFDKNGRNVQMMGEAFFEVVKNKEKPFLIKAGSANIRVLGTSFLVQSEKETSKVMVSTGIIEFTNSKNPGEKAILKAGEKGTLINGGINTSIINDLNYLSWKTGVFQFDDNTLEYVIQKLSEYYDKPVQLQKGFTTNCKLTANFDKEELSIIIETIKYSCNLEVTDFGYYYELKNIEP